MKKNLRSILALLLTAAMLLSLAACGAKPEEKPEANAIQAQGNQDVQENNTTEAEKNLFEEEYIIGVAVAQANDATVLTQTYLEDFVAPLYNVKFIFSETLMDEASVKVFIENCIDAGADAIIDFKAGTPEMARLCEEAGVYYTIQYTINNAFYEDEFPYLVGYVGGDTKQSGDLYYKWISENASETGEEGFLITTSIASSGNGLHQDLTKAMLNALADRYDLTYNATVEELCMTSQVLDVENDKGILITLFPGSPNKDTWLPGVSSLLQAGKYGVFMSCGQTFNQSATVVSEVEQSFNKDIKVVCLGNLGAALDNAFNTKDSFGNYSIDCAMVQFTTVQAAELFAITYNALSGYNNTANRHEDGTFVDGRCTRSAFTSPEQLTSTTGWDVDGTGMWTGTKEHIDSLLAVYHPEITAVDVEAIISSVSYDTIAADLNG